VFFFSANFPRHSIPALSDNISRAPPGPARPPRPLLA
jgi:hypothetical protein